MISLKRLAGTVVRPAMQGVSYRFSKDNWKDRD